MTSFLLNLEAIGLTVLISLVLSYLTVIPVFRPLVAGISRRRFLSLVGFTLVFTLMFGGGRPLKVSLLVFAMTVFYMSSIASVIAQIPKEAFDHARTLRMSEWRVVWEIVILGTVDKAFEVLRQNAAIGWMMLTMVEGIVRGEGGIATALLNQNKYLLMPEVFAIQILILFVGLLQVSGGQRQRVAIVQQFMCSDHFLLLDEPFSGLDRVAEEGVCNFIREIAQTDELKTIILVTHDIRAAVEVSDTPLAYGSRP